MDNSMPVLTKAVDRLIVAKDGAAMRAQIAERGLDHAYLFFKCSAEYEQSHAIAAGAPQDQKLRYVTRQECEYPPILLAREFEVGLGLHEALPELTAKPELLVMNGTDIVGHLHEFVEGRLLSTIGLEVIGKIMEAVEGESVLEYYLYYCTIHLSKPDANQEAGRHAEVSIEQYLDYLRRHAAAIEEVQKSGLIHGDPQPQNTIITPTGKVVLIDPNPHLHYDAGEPYFDPAQSRAQDQEVKKYILYQIKAFEEALRR